MSTQDVFNKSHQEICHRNVTESSSNKNVVSVLKILVHRLGVVFPFSDQTKDFGNNNNKVVMEDCGNVVGKHVGEGPQTLSYPIMETVRLQAEFMAQDLVHTFGENVRKPPNKYCKTLRRTVAELSAKHILVFKGIVNRLDIDDDNVLQTFVIVADELFDEGQVNWGRIVAVYAFAAHLAKYLADKIDASDNDKVSNISGQMKSALLKEKIATFVGKYLTNKLGQWIIDHGGWDAFVEFFPDHDELEARIWKVGLFTAFGLGALATIIATR